jgi:hypothetical protein
MSTPVFDDLNQAPLPDASTLRRRRNLFIQFAQFIRFNLRMLAIIGAGEK